MDSPTPKYDIGDKVQIPHKKTEAVIDARWYSEQNGSWIYRVYRVKGDRRIKAYQEKNLSQ